MRFAFTDDQLGFRDAVRDLLAAECPPEVVRAAWDGDRAPADAVYAKLAEMGVVGCAASEDNGGLGFAPVDWVLLFEEIGRACVPGPLAETTAAVVPLLSSVGGDAAGELLAGVVDGTTNVTFGSDAQPLVVDADAVDRVVVGRGDALFVVAPADVTVTAQESVDGARRTATVTLPDGAAPVASGPDVAAALAAAADRAALAAAAELTGGARAMLDVTVAYAKDRHQFGVPIGSFQAVKHHLSDAAMAVAFAEPLVHRAAWSLSVGDADAAVHVSMAKAQASDAARFVAAQALQVHGAIGYSYEYDLQMWMKRAWALAAAWGSAAAHRERVATVLLDRDDAVWW